MVENKILIVEGQEDKYTIAELMGKHIYWPEDKNMAPVNIKPAGSIETILKKEFISSHIKANKADIIGIIIDADEKLVERWQKLKSICLEFISQFPDALPYNGFIGDFLFGKQKEKRLGIWIMPDNKSNGMLETFLSTLVGDNPKLLWDKAQRSTNEAISIGAPCKPVHKDKAYIHTWLSWQNPPGDRFGTAIKANILRSDSEKAKSFVNWFKTLYYL